jgi:hypothetical protein
MKSKKQNESSILLYTREILYKFNPQGIRSKKPNAHSKIWSKQKNAE